MADDAVRFACEVCGSNIDLKRCSRCKRAMYCSRDHQANHWPIHKAACKQVTAQNRLNDGEVGADRSCSGKCEIGQGLTQNEKSGVDTDCVSIKEKSHVSNEKNADSDADTNKHNSQNDSVVEFDSRPFTNTQFDKPPSFDYEDLAKYMTTNLKSSGYCVTDGLFDGDLLTKVQDEFTMVSESGQMKPGQLSGGKTSGEDELKVTKTEIRSDKLAWIEGTESHIPSTGEVVKIMDDIIGRFNQYLEGEYFIKGRTKAMMACYPGNGSFYRRHVDNPNKDGRVITCILYLNSAWDVERDGGMLRILPEGRDDHLDIAPVLNRFLVFWSDGRNPHEVHPAHRTRYALTVWYFDADERIKAKEDRISEEMSKIRGELSLLQLKTMEAERDNLSQKIANESMKAVSMLSEEELDALAALVKGHPEPASVLSGLGIAATIQDALLTVLSNRNSPS